MSTDHDLPERVLVVRLGAIGDVTQALAFAGALKARRPDVHLGWAVHPLARPLVEGHPWVDRVHVWARGGGAAELSRLVRELRAERYDLAVDLQRILKSALLCRLSGARRSLGYDRGRAKELSWLLHRERIPSGHPRQAMVEQVLAFAAYLGCPPASPLRALPSDPGAEAWADVLLGAGPAPVVVHLGATKPQNRWEAERYGELLERLASAGVNPLCFTGGPADRALSGPRAEVAGVRDLVGRTSLPQLVSLLRRARLFVGCDTGPMHLAAAVGCPVLALFGPADPLRTGPYGTGHRVLRHPPALDRDTPLGHASMDTLGADEVAVAALDLLAGGPSPGTSHQEPRRSPRNSP